MQNYERRMVRGREIEFRSLSEAEFRRGNVIYQVWAILPDGKNVLIGEAVNRTWAFWFVRMIPFCVDEGKVKVIVVESNGQKLKKLEAASLGFRHSNRRSSREGHLNRNRGGRIDWASYGRDEC
jgi:hypothetical protein